MPSLPPLPWHFEHLPVPLQPLHSDIYSNSFLKLLVTFTKAACVAGVSYKVEVQEETQRAENR